MEKNRKTRIPSIALPSIKPSPTAALVVALLALVAGLSMPAQAAIERLANGTVGTAQLKDGAVTTPKLRYGAVTSPKIRNGSVTVADLSTQARPKLPRSVGSTYDTWKAVGGNDVEVARLVLPAGRWLVTAKAAAGTSATMKCDLRRGHAPLDATYSAGGSSWSYDTMALLAPVVAGGASVRVVCSGPEGASVGYRVLTAVEVR